MPTLPRSSFRTVLYYGEAMPIFKRGVFGVGAFPQQRAFGTSRLDRTHCTSTSTTAQSFDKSPVLNPHPRGRLLCSAVFRGQRLRAFECPDFASPSFFLAAQDLNPFCFQALRQHEKNGESLVQSVCLGPMAKKFAAALQQSPPMVCSVPFPPGAPRLQA